MTVLAVSGDTYWTIALLIGLAAAVVVAILLVLLLQAIGRIRRSVDGLLEVAGQVGANTAHIPQLEATAPVLGEIVTEAVVQDGYMSALTDGYGVAGVRSQMLVLSVLLAVVVVAVLAVALIRIRQGLEAVAQGLATLHEALQNVESAHLRPLEPAVRAINAQFDVILGALPGIAAKAAVVAERRPR